MRSAAVWLNAFSLLLICCGGGATKRPPNVGVAGVPATNGQAGGQRVWAGPEGLPRLEVPREAGCSVKTQWWEPDRASLRFRLGVPPFAEIIGRAGDVSVSFPVGRSELGATVELSVLGAPVRGNVAAEELPLYPTKPFVVAGVVVPGGSTRLRWEATAPGAFSLRLAPSRRVRLAEPARLVRWPCDGATLDRTSFVAEVAKVQPALRTTWPAKLRASGSVPVAASPGGPTRATVEPRPDDPLEVAVGPTQGKETLIAWWLPEQEGESSALVVGWVPSSMMMPMTPSSVGVVRHVAEGSVCALGSSANECLDEPAELIAEVGGEMRVVGEMTTSVFAHFETGDDGEFMALTSLEVGGGLAST